MSQENLVAKIRELKELKAMQEELKAEITALEDDIKAEMTAQGTDEMVVDVFKVKWIPLTSSRFDSKAFKATHGELYNQYIKKTSTKRFSIA